MQVYRSLMLFCLELFTDKTSTLFSILFIIDFYNAYFSKQGIY